MTSTSQSDARRAAAESLLKIEKLGRYSNIEIDSHLKSGHHLSDADRALYTRLVYGVIERRLTLDCIISQYSSKPICDIDSETATALRLGMYQLIYTDRIPDFAAVSASVDTAPRRSRGFVNGVLRSFIRADKKYTLPCGTDAESMSIRHSTGTDICRILSDSYGTETAEKILDAFHKSEGITLRVNTLKCSNETALSMLPSAKPSEYCPDTVKLQTLDETAREGIEKGLWFVQDSASRIATTILGARPGENIADVCAAPGGKSFSAAIDMNNCGNLYSFDLHENKLSLIRRTAQRLGITCISTAARDARMPTDELAGKCDRVICDAPCSGIGVIGKKPELRYKNLDSIKALPQIQLDVLCGASNYVKEGGVLIYSTCTLNREENENVVTRFLAEHREFVLTPFNGIMKSDSGMLTLFPQITGTDGFFMAKMIRRSR